MKKLYYIIIIIASLLIMIPFNLIFTYEPEISLNWIIFFVGYLLLFTQFKKYNITLRIMLIIMVILTILGIIGICWNNILDSDSSWKTNTMADLGAYIIPWLLFYISYFVPRIMCLVFDIIFFFKQK